MSLKSRYFLLLAALALGVFTAYGLVAFSAAAEPDDFTAGNVIFAIGASILFAAPLWLPAAIPSRFVILSKIIRWINAIALLIPTYFSASILSHNMKRLSSGYVLYGPLSAGLLLTAICLLGIAVLIWPEARTWLEKRGFFQTESHD